MTSDKKHAPDSLKYQWRLLGSVHRSDWATSLDKSVAFEVIDNYRKAHGNSRASLRYLEKATGATRPSVIASLRRLCENGPFSVALQGGGTRPTAYALHFDTVAEIASGIAGNTSSNPDPSGIVGNTSVVSQAIPLDAASGIAGNTESVLLVDGLQAGLLDRMNDTAPATPPPPGDGLAATPSGEAPVEGLASSQAEPTFESLWRTYDYPRGKKEARAAWKALPPDTELTAVIEAAAGWQASWAAQGKPDAPRYTLARWLADERYDEDAPTGFTKPEKASKAKPANANAGRATIPAKASHAFAEGETRLTIVKADVVKGAASSSLVFVASDENGVEYNHATVLEHHNEDIQAAGQRKLREIVSAAGYGQIEDSKELLGREIVAVVEGGKLEFVAPLERKPQLDPAPVPVAPPPPPSKPLTEADVEAIKARVAAAPPMPRSDYGTQEWEERRAAKQAALREWDAAHPEMFRVRPLTQAEEAQRADYDAWFEASLEEDQAA
jgi:hypothetical protein